MTRDAAISVRVEATLKEALEEAAKSEGRTLASYVARILETRGQIPKWILADPEPHYHSKKGATVLLRIAEGWPACALPVEKAEALGKELTNAALRARKMTT